jgi:dihydrolipoamide dehydrogenase
MFDIVVIGGGPAGVTAALRARELGATVALVERGQTGGTCTNDGCAPTRVLAKAARLMRDAELFDEYGLEGDVPRLNWERLLARTHYVVNVLHEKKQLIGHLQASGIETFIGAGDVRFVNAHTLALPSRDLPADKFILCAGGHARRLNFEGAELALTHSDVWSLKELPPRVAIVGGAATGCQLAAVLDLFGSRVTMLELAPRILAVEDEETSTVLRREFEERGIHIVTGMSGVTRLEQVRDGLRLTYGLGQEQVPLEVDAVIVAVGWVGNVETLNLEAAGVQTNRGYVVVNDALQTTAPNIYAAGDITGRMMLVQGATQEALVAAENAVRGTAHEFRHTIVPHGGFTDPEYGSVGLTEAQARAKFECVVSTVSYAEMDRAVIDNATTGFCKLIAAQDTQMILGAHVVGEQALEVTQIVAAAMAANARVGDLARLEIAYPTYSGIIGLAARRIVRQMGFAETDAEWKELGRLQGAEWERADSEAGSLGG